MRTIAVVFMGLVTQIEQNRNELGTEKERLQKEGKFFLFFFSAEEAEQSNNTQFLASLLLLQIHTADIGNKMKKPFGLLPGVGVEI